MKSICSYKIIKDIWLILYNLKDLPIEMYEKTYNKIDNKICSQLSYIKLIHIADRLIKSAVYTVKRLLLN